MTDKELIEKILTWWNIRKDLPVDYRHSSFEDWGWEIYEAEGPLREAAERYLLERDGKEAGMDDNGQRGPLPLATVVDYNPKEAVYLGDELILHGERLTPGGVLGGLGYTVDHLRFEWRDIPGMKMGERIPHPPESLAELKAHLRNLKVQRRKERIKGTREELTQLEKEDKEDAD